MTIEAPSAVGGRYVCGRLLGSGGMADVYRGTDRVLERPVAIKVLRQVDLADATVRFENEVHTLAALDHPGVVTLLDAGIRDEQPYLVMQLVEGPTLGACCRGQALDPARVRSIGRQLAEALAYAHDAGVVHRDVKPSNVLVGDDDRVLLTDFGIARLAGATEYTLPGTTIGSPAYLAPEQVSGAVVTPAVDVFSLGLVLLEALTGVRAYDGTPVEAAIARLQQAPTIPDHVEDDWRALITRMTARAPEDRPTAHEVAAALGTTTLPSAVPATDVEHTAVLDLDATGLITPEPDAPDLAVLDEVTWTSSWPAFWYAVRRKLARREVLVSVTAGGLLVALLVLIVALSQGGTDPVVPVVQLPAGVADPLQQPLQDLHRAVEGEPR